MYKAEGYSLALAIACALDPSPIKTQELSNTPVCSCSVLLSCYKPFNPNPSPALCVTVRPQIILQKLFSSQVEYAFYFEVLNEGNGLLVPWRAMSLHLDTALFPPMWSWPPPFACGLMLQNTSSLFPRATLLCSLASNPQDTVLSLGSGNEGRRWEQNLQ